MKAKNKQCFLIAALFCAPLAQAQDASYWTIHGGLNNASDWPAKVNFGGPTVNASLELERGANFGAALGRQYGKARYELEYQHGQFTINGATVAAIRQSADATGKYDLLMANAYRVLPISDAMALYAGLGVGYGRINLPAVNASTGCKCLSEASKGSATYQGRIGMEFRASQSGMAFLQASYISLPGARSDGAAFVSYPRRGFATLGLGYRGLFQ